MTGQPFLLVTKRYSRFMPATLVLDDPDETKPAPGPLRRVQALINTLARYWRLTGRTPASKGVR